MGLGKIPNEAQKTAITSLPSTKNATLSVWNAKQVNVNQLKVMPKSDFERKKAKKIWKLLISTHKLEERWETFYRTQTVFLVLIQNLFQGFYWHQKSEMFYRDQLFKMELANGPFIWVRHLRKTVRTTVSQSEKGVWISTASLQLIFCGRCVPVPGRKMR